jgi:hypothetical protein
MVTGIMKKFIVAAAILSLSACATSHIVRHYDVDNPLKKVAVLPLKNDTDDVDGPNNIRKKMIEALEAKSYIVKDVKETDQFLRDQMGINIGGQLDMTTPQKLGEALGVEGVLYGTLMDFGEMTTGLVNVRKVRAKFKLVNTQTGQAFWERGLGVRSETRMSGRSGAVASLVSRGSDAADKDVPWITIDSSSINEQNVGKALAIGLGAKLLSKAAGIHLENESKEMVRRVAETLPWGPGPGATTTTVAEVKPPAFQAPEIKMPQPPSFGYLDYGKKDFSAVLISVTVDKESGDSFNYNIPFAKAGQKIRMDMDMSSFSKSGQEMPPAFSRMSTIHDGDKKLSYILYPNANKYMTRNYTDNYEFNEMPHVEKTKLGNEVIDSHSTEKYKVVITYKDGRKEEGVIWNAYDLDGMTIRSEVENKDSKVTTQFKKISIKRPAASTFEIPTGYTEAKGFMDLMMNTTK